MSFLSQIRKKTVWSWKKRFIPVSTRAQLVFYYHIAILGRAVCSEFYVSMDFPFLMQKFIGRGWIDSLWLFWATLSRKNMNVIGWETMESILAYIQQFQSRAVDDDDDIGRAG